MDLRRAIRVIVLLCIFISIAFTGCKKQCPDFENIGFISRDAIMKNNISEISDLRFIRNDSLNQWQFSDTGQVDYYNKKGFSIMSRSSDKIKQFSYYRSGQLKRMIEKWNDSTVITTYKYIYNAKENSVLSIPSSSAKFTPDTLKKSLSSRSFHWSKAYLTPDYKVAGYEFKSSAFEYIYKDGLLSRWIWHLNGKPVEGLSGTSERRFFYDNRQLVRMVYYNQMNKPGSVTYYNKTGLIDSMVSLDEDSIPLNVVKYRYKRF
jgi:hypothetical protein